MAAVLPHRGNDFYSADFGPMFDLGQYVVRDGFELDQNKFSDDDIRGLIANTNVVVNFIGARVPMNHFSMCNVNYDWPVRLARLVAEKNDGTKLINLSFMNSHDEVSRGESVILQQQWAAEQKIKEIYPESIRVRSSWAFTHVANFAKWHGNYLDLITNKRWHNFAGAGSWPLLLNGGKRTFHRPVSSGDLCEAVIRIIKHPDSPGHTFEIYGDERLQLNEIFNHTYEVRNDEAFCFEGIKTTFDLETGERTAEPADLQSQIRLGYLKKYFNYYTMPRGTQVLFLRFIDMWSRTHDNKTNSYQWLTESMWWQLNQSCKIENRNNPGLSELGIVPEKFTERVYEFAGVRHARNQWEYINNNSKAWNHIPKNYPDNYEQLPQTPVPELKFNKLDREIDLKLYNWNREQELRENWTAWHNRAKFDIETGKRTRSVTDRMDNEISSAGKLEKGFRKPEYTVVRGLPKATY